MKASLKTPLPSASKEPLHLLMGISEGQNYQSDKKLLAFVDMINAKHDSLRFVTIMLTGYLHRHYIQLYHPHPHEKTKEMDQNWLKANQTYLNFLEVPHQIMHWETLLEKPSFQTGIAATNHLYQQDKTFQQIVNSIAHKFAPKIITEIQTEAPNTNLTLEQTINACRDYCLEESSVIFGLIDLGINVQVYPGKWNQAMQYVYDKLIPGNPLPWIEYRIS